MRLSVEATPSGKILLEHNEQIGCKALGEEAMGLLYEIANNELSEDSPLGIGTLDEIATLATYNLIEVTEVETYEEYTLEVTLEDGSRHYPSHEPEFLFTVAGGIASLYDISDGEKREMSKVTSYQLRGIPKDDH